MEREKVERIVKEMEGSEPWFCFIVKKIAQMTFVAKKSGNSVYDEKIVSKVRRLSPDGLKVFINQMDLKLHQVSKKME